MDKAEPKKAGRGTSHRRHRVATKRILIHEPECRVAVHRSAFLGFLSGNAAIRLVDVSEREAVVEVKRKLQKGAHVRVRLRIGRFHETFRIDAVVRTCQREKRGLLAYLDFESVPTLFTACIGDLRRAPA